MKDLNQSSSQDILHNLSFKVCVGVSHGVKNCNPRYEGHIILPGTKMTKFDFFMFRDSLLALMRSSRLTRDSSSFKLLFESIVLVSSANR